MPSRDAEFARVLLSRADEDLAAARALSAREEISDRIVGFHVQQAVEKCLKAVLGARGVRYPFTHELEALVLLLEPGEIEDLNELLDAKSLTPWAGEFRYAEPPADELDRAGALRRAESVRAWAERLVR